MSPQELREDISVLNVVNFGGGAYVIYAEVLPTRRDRGRPRAVLGHVRPPGAAAADRGQGAGRGDRPDRTSPSRSCAPRARRSSTRSGFDPVEEGLQIVSPDGRRRRHPHGRARGRTRHRLLEIEYWSQTEDRYSERVVEPYALFNGTRGLVRRRLGPGRATGCATSGWTGSSAPRRSTSTSSAAPDLDPIADIGGWPRTGRVGGSRVARVWISRRAGALGAREARRRGRARGRRDRRRVGRSRARDFLVQRGAQGGGRRGRARAGRRPRGGADRRRAPARAQHVSRRAAIAMTPEEAAAFLDEQRTRRRAPRSAATAGRT